MAPKIKKITREEIVQGYDRKNSKKKKNSEKKDVLKEKSLPLKETEKERRLKLAKDMSSRQRQRVIVRLTPSMTTMMMTSLYLI